jgi:hypothetical protein
MYEILIRKAQKETETWKTDEYMEKENVKINISIVGR